jgi:hypothetical protein
VANPHTNRSNVVETQMDERVETNWQESDVASSNNDHSLRVVFARTSLSSLPDGCFVQIDGSSFLLWQGALLMWSPEGYLKKHHETVGSKVTVLTPEPLVQCMCQGYVPLIHGSSLAL